MTKPMTAPTRTPPMPMTAKSSVEPISENVMSPSATDDAAR